MNLGLGSFFFILLVFLGVVLSMGVDWIGDNGFFCKMSFFEAGALVKSSEFGGSPLFSFYG